MVIREFNSLDEIKKYYDEKINTYVFKEDNKYIRLVVFNFDLNIDACIDASNIKALNINALNISALDIRALDIDIHNLNARDIEANNIYCTGNIDALYISAKDIRVEDFRALEVDVSDIDARNIRIDDIIAKDILAGDIIAKDIRARNIYYYAVCVAYNNIKCKTIRGTLDNAKHLVLDGKIETEVDEL